MYIAFGDEPLPPLQQSAVHIFSTSPHFAEMAAICDAKGQSEDASKQEKLEASFHVVMWRLLPRPTPDDYLVWVETQQNVNCANALSHSAAQGPQKAQGGPISQ